MRDLMDNQSLIGNEKTVIEMISNQVHMEKWDL